MSHRHYLPIGLFILISIYNEVEGEIELTIELDGVTYEPKDSLNKAKEWELERDSLLDEFNNFDWEKFRQDSIDWHERLNRPNRDKRNIVILVNDSLKTPEVNFLDLTYRLTPKGFRANFQLEDSWRILAIKLLESDLNSEHLNFQELTDIGEYKLKPVNYEPGEQDRIVAILTFSRVVFNDDKSKACYYYKEFCGHHCGYGYLVFVECFNGKWKLKAKRDLWVS